MSIETYARPSNLEEALQLMAGGNATVFAGGTDLMPQTKAGTRKFRGTLVNLNRIAQLHGITRENGSVRIGALTTVTEILGDPLLNDKASVLSDTADHFASGQVRNSATLGGNICNASPAGDMIIPLILLDAEFEIASWKENAMTTRRVAVTDFFTGPGRTVLERDELLTAIRFPIPGENHVARFRKFGTRPALDISVVSIGIAGRLADGTLNDVRVAFGAVAPIPLRGVATESAIEAKELNAESIREMAKAAAEEITPIDDVRATAWYRREITRTFTERILHELHNA
jgi:CO/xanthine dehydrogenase FAD-binding subunit